MRLVCFYKLKFGVKYFKIEFGAFFKLKVWCNFFIKKVWCTILYNLVESCVQFYMQFQSGKVYLKFDGFFLLVCLNLLQKLRAHSQVYINGKLLTWKTWKASCFCFAIHKGGRKTKWNEMKGKTWLQENVTIRKRWNYLYRLGITLETFHFSGTVQAFSKPTFITQSSMNPL